MDTEILRKKYAKLTPFEIASMRIIESVGQRRDAEMVALEGKNAWNELHVSWWERDFITLASIAVFNSARAEYYAALSVNHDSEDWTKVTIEASNQSISWIKALKELADYTKAPLMETAKMISGSYPERKLKEAYEGLRYKKQYDILRRLWEELTKYCNVSDEHRRNIMYSDPVKRCNRK